MTSSQLPPESENAWTERRQKLARRQTTFLMVLVACTLVGLRWNRYQRSNQQVELERLLNGTFELEQVADQKVGENSDLLSQKITFSGGKMAGETRIKTNSPAGTTAIPFPDKTISGYRDSLDGEVTTFRWQGAYSALSGWRMTCHVGTSTYTVNTHWDAKTHILSLERDFILTYPGPFRYRLVASYAPSKP